MQQYLILRDCHIPAKLLVSTVNLQQEVQQLYLRLRTVRWFIFIRYHILEFYSFLALTVQYLYLYFHQIFTISHLVYVAKVNTAVLTFHTFLCVCVCLDERVTSCWAGQVSRIHRSHDYLCLQNVQLRMQRTTPVFYFYLPMGNNRIVSTAHFLSFQATLIVNIHVTRWSCFTFGKSK